MHSAESLEYDMDLAENEDWMEIKRLVAGVRQHGSYKRYARSPTETSSPSAASPSAASCRRTTPSSTSSRGSATTESCGTSSRSGARRTI